MRKKPLSSLVLLMLTLSLLSALSVNTIRVSAGEYPALYVDPPSITDVGMTPPSTFTVSIKTDYNGSDITAYQFTLNYNPAVLNGVSVTNGDLIIPEVDPSAYFIPGNFDNTNGRLSLTAAAFFLPEPVPVTSGPGTLANVTFEVVGIGDSPITIGAEVATPSVLFGYSEGGTGDQYEIINALRDPYNIQHGYFRNLPVIHDIAVVSVKPNATEVIENDLVDVMVNVTNNGEVTETFDVSTYFDVYNFIGEETGVPLESGKTTTLTFTWDTDDVSPATHTLRAAASTVPGETNTEDNTLTSPQTVTVLAPVVAVIDAPDEGVYRQPVTFDASGSKSERGTIIEYYWDFGDGLTANVSDPIITHTYKWLGDYGVWLWVTDDTGETSDAGYHTIRILYEADYLADLVKWKAKAEKHHWIASKDDDKNVTLTALAKNTGTRAINTTITFAILDVKAGEPIWADSVHLWISVPGDEVTVSVLFDPFNDYDDWDETSKVVLYAHVTLKYDSTGNGTPDKDASTKIARFSIMP